MRSGVLSGAGKVAVAALVAHAALSAVIALEWIAYAVVPSISESLAVQRFVHGVDVLDRLCTPAAAILFVVWCSGIFREAHEAGVKTTFTRRAAVWSFFIPVVNLFRPYAVLADLERASDPSKLPEPPLEPLSPERFGGYRASAAEARARITALPAPLRSWWGLFVMRVMLNVLDRLSHQKQPTLGFALVANALELVGATVTAVVLVRLSRRVRAWAAASQAASPSASPSAVV